MNGPEHKLFKLLNICNIKGDPQSSSTLNLHNSYVIDLINNICNGDVSYNGWFKFEYNSVDNSLDLVSFNNTKHVICKISDTEIVI
jgi:hypothetical protein